MCRFVRASLLPVLLAVMVLVAAAGEDKPAAVKPPASWEGPLLKPVARQEVYEFAEPPTCRRVGPDRYEISFATKDNCDVAVAIHDASDKIIKHVVYGVLGANAPEPLQKNSLKQTLTWNGKDDWGAYVNDVKSLQVRVSLGLKVDFDKIIGWHPKDLHGTVSALGADQNGVYAVISAGGLTNIRAYNRDTSYQKTIYPFPADKLAELKGVDLQPVEGQAPGVPKRSRFAHIGHYVALGQAKSWTTPAIHNGLMAIYGVNDFAPILRIATDGSTGGASALGPNLASTKSQFGKTGELAVSPDGKWLYVTRLFPGDQINPFVPFKGEKVNRRGYCPRHAVYRIGWDADKPLDERVSFFGEGVKADTDNTHLDNPEGVATDAQGRVYISDCNNNRVVVVSPEGKFLQAIPVQRPRRLAVHQKSGAIYVTAFDWTAANLKLIKFSPLPDAKPVIQQDIPSVYHQKDNEGGPCHRTVFCLDSWSAPARVWLAEGPELQVWEERGNRFEKVEDFTQTVRQDGYLPHVFSPGYRLVRVTADALRGHLYYTHDLSSVVYRYDPEEGKKAVPIRVAGQGGKMNVPGSGTRSLSLTDDIHMGFDGLFYCRSIQYLARFDPTVLERDEQTGGFRFVKEVPFDYGEIRDRGLEFPASGIQLPAMIPGNGFNMGMGIAPNGNILVLCDNFQTTAGLGTIRTLESGYFNPQNTDSKLPNDRYRPGQFPGRQWTASTLIFVWDKKGQLIGKDLITAPETHTSGIRGDKDGNIYIGLAAHKMIDGKAFGPFGGGGNVGPGSVVKFPPTGGKIYGTWGNPLKLDKEPNRPPDFATHGAKVWADNMLWSVGGLSTCGVNGTCRCPQSRFDVDWYGRVFIPETWRFGINIVDTNGNSIMRIGRYGNADSGRGAASTVPVPGGIAFSQCDYLCTVTDKWLYVNDNGNFRIVRMKLGYHAEKRASFE